MNCFKHQDRPAIGICRSCGKGLCGDCLVEVKNGLACKRSCEDRVKLINRIIDSNSRILMAAQSQVRHTGLFALFMGIGLLIFGVYVRFHTEDSFIPYFIIFFGALFCVVGILRLSRKERYPQLDKENL